MIIKALQKIKEPLKGLGNSDIIFEMSQVKGVVNWMTGKLVNDVINKITRSNLKKIKKRGMDDH